MATRGEAGRGRASKQTLQTPAGEVWLWGDDPAADERKPLVLAIAGALDDFDSRLFRIRDALPEATVLGGHLPGNHCPYAAHDLRTYVEAYSSALAQLRRPAVALGASVGGLVALGLTSSNLAGVVALEPPIRTGKLWPLVDNFRDRLRDAPGNANLREFFWRIFGISDEAHVDRDHSWVLRDLRVPAWVTFGAEPLFPVRSFEKLPSLVDEPERALIRAHPKTRTAVAAERGHGLPPGLQIAALVRQLLPGSSDEGSG